MERALFLALALLFRLVSSFLVPAFMPDCKGMNIGHRDREPGGCSCFGGTYHNGDDVKDCTQDAVTKSYAALN